MMIKQIQNYPNYSITNAGKVWSYLGNRWLKPIKQKDGYLAIDLGYKNRWYIHRLVLYTFVGECPKNMECRHLDGNPLNNNIDNLCWGTRSENQRDSVRHGIVRYGENSNHHKLTRRDVRIIIYTYRTRLFTQREIADIYNISKAQIGKIINKKSWKHIWNKTYD